MLINSNECYMHTMKQDYSPWMLSLVLQWSGHSLLHMLNWLFLENLLESKYWVQEIGFIIAIFLNKKLPKKQPLVFVGPIIFGLYLGGGRKGSIINFILGYQMTINDSNMQITSNANSNECIKLIHLLILILLKIQEKHHWKTAKNGNSREITFIS